ncbi:MAG: family 78 glycoside hydrolase catalytic domain [Prevotella sp.]|nr:family 78 glycoside hydrolase catalytic domain [Prevotella sp.]
MLLPFTAAAQVAVGQLRVENLDNPLGIDTSAPRFSWQITSDKKNVVQTAYHLIVSDDRGEVWNSGRVSSDEQLWVAYRGQKLKSGQYCTWRVKVYTNRGESEWSPEQHFSIGLLGESHWSGRWIGLERLMPGEERGLHTRLAARYLRKEFSLQKPVKRALAYVSGLGLHELHLNGKTYNDYVMRPMPTDYRRTVLYNVYDVTADLQQQNCIGIVLGNGRLFPMRQNKPYKAPVFGLPKCRINLIVEFTDGTQQRISTDEKWRITADGPIRSNNEYDGETYDARHQLSGWDRTGYDDSQWLQAERTELPLGTLRAQMAPGMKATPFATRPTRNGNILDFHQNMAGWIAFTPTGREGDTIRIRYAEKLNADGTLYTENLRDAQSEDIYVCGRQNERWHPTFVFHGFRYAEVSGPASDFAAYTVSDEMASTGTFSCSDTILNKVMHNAWWGIYSNYKGMPVDCPQRNERQPWLGDRTVGSLGESFLFDNERLYTKWMRDICESQRADGVFSDVAPAFWNYYNDDVTWPAALPFTCDMLYRQYGNDEAIRHSYPAIQRWMQHLLDEYVDADGIVVRDTYGDWCVPPESLELIFSNDPTRKTDGSLISTAYTIRCLQLLEQFARLQSLSDDAGYYNAKRQIMTDAFNRRFLTVRRGTSAVPGHPLYPDSVFYGNNTATANLLPLAFGIVPDDCRDEVVKNVVQNIIVKNNGHVSCGVIGISWLLRGLSDNGFSDIAYLLATNKSYPSWGYMAENGATTIWELWNGNTANPRMNSGNHVMLLGDLVTWGYQHIGGIRNDSTAYKHFTLRPDFQIQDCSSADVSYHSPYGPIKSQWKKTLQHVEWDVEVPVNTTADVCLPDGTVKHIGSGQYHYSVDIPTASPAIVKDEFLYEQASFPQCHAATIVERRNGDLVAAYFGGKHERNPDVCIWVSIKKKGSKTWSEPILAGDGVFQLGTPDALLAGINDSTTLASAGPIKEFAPAQVATLGAQLRRKATWNPVLYEMPDGELWLFYKIGLKVADWTGWLVKSTDGGRTWGKREPLPEGFIGPVKNKPELINGRLLCPSSTEPGGWKFHVEIYDLATKHWKYVGPVEAELAARTEDAADVKPIDCIQPSILKLRDGRLQVLMRTRNGRLATSFSGDNGDTWSKVTLLDVPNNQSGTDAVTLRDGRHVLIYNDFSTLPGTKKGPRTPLSIAVSDDGTHWHHALTLEASPISQYSYPAIIEGRDGRLHCVYTWRRQRVAYKQIDIKKLK